MTNAPMVALISNADSTFSFITKLLFGPRYRAAPWAAAASVPAAERPLHDPKTEEEHAVAQMPMNPGNDAPRRRDARILVAEAHPIGRSTLERACWCVATDVHVVASWRKFSEVLDELEDRALAPDLVILGDAFSHREESEAEVLSRFPSARVVRLPNRVNGALLAA